MNPIKSMAAFYYRKRIENFNKTGYSRKLKSLKDSSTMNSCFIIGNGPSLSACDLEQIQRKSIPTFAFNRIYYMFERTTWKPTYYISQDEKILAKSLNEIDSLELPYKFIPLNYKYYYGVNVKNALYFNLVNSTTDTIALSEDISKCIYNSNTVVITAIQLAVYFGYKKIYLLGIDHSFNTYTNDKGEIIKDVNAKDYFTEKYNCDKEDLYIPNLDKSTRDYYSANNFCMNHGIQIFNATRGGKLEVFPRIDFDELISKL